MGPELAFGESVLRILLVLVLAGAIGVERELRDHEAGLRTHMLVGVGAALFVIAGNFAWSELTFGNEAGIVLDPSRVVAYVVTGVGFLGAGAILKNGGSIRGLTTAASLWVVAAIGVVVGSGQYALGLFATAVVLVSLWPMRRAARVIGLRRRDRRSFVLLLEPGASAALTEIVEVAGRARLDVRATAVAGDESGSRLEVTLSGDEEALLSAVDRLTQAPGIHGWSLVTDA
jgi:putative Mg2+ transporter-C (MgtC) family protein